MGENAYKKEFVLAKEILAGFDGKLKRSNAPYQAFKFKSDKVCLVFYPHKTSAGNYYLRVRDEGSKDRVLANILMKKLFKESGSGVLFCRNKQWEATS